jgi:hypothetical protein
MMNKDHKTSIIHEGLWQQLTELDGCKTAQRAKCQFLNAPERYTVTILNIEYAVNPADKQIFPVGGCSKAEPAGFLEQLCLLAYLINAQDSPLANKLVRAEALPGGQFFFRGLHSLPTKKLEEAFGRCPKRLYEITEQFGAKRCEFGDAAIELYVLPRVPLTIVIWRGDEEFDARASILFDQTAASQLPLDALWAAANLTAEAIIKAVD